jgi:hypothetical protein
MLLRYQILRNIDKINLKEWMNQRQHTKLVVAACIVFTFCMYIPHYFQFTVVEVACLDLENLDLQDCYQQDLSCITESTAWVAYGAIFQGRDSPNAR